MIVNRKAKFEYKFIDTYTAGLVLTGSVVKSIRQAKFSLVDEYCYFEENELWMNNIKLLLKRRELKHLQSELATSAYTIIPYKIFETDKGIFKMEIALARGKKLYDKRDIIKKRDIERELQKKT